MKRLIQIAASPPCNRRQFLSSCLAPAACAVCAGLAPARAAAPSMPAVKPKLRLVFAHPVPEREGWPYQGYDYEGRKRDLLGRLRAGRPNVEFLPVWTKDAEEAKRVLAADAEVDGYLVYILGIPTDAPRLLAFSGRPVLLVDDLYGGTGQFLGVYGPARSKGMPVAGVTSTRFEDVLEAVKAFECLSKLKASVLLDVDDRDLGSSLNVYRETLGVAIRKLPGEELNAAYGKADAGQARQWAQTWIKNAEKVVEPSAAEIQKSAAMYVAMRDLMAQHSAQGIAVDCLRLFYGKKLPAYPCLGFFQLNDDGFVGACEGDLQSAATMLLLSYLVGRPGYISDPVIDTAKNQVIYAHCVAPSKVYGPAGPANPFHIRSHSEDRKGASVRSLMPLGQMTTSLKFIPAEKTVVLHRAKTVENIDEDRACRTKLAAEGPDARKLALEWRWGWHRVTVYGDVKVPVENLSALLGFKLVEEG